MFRKSKIYSKSSSETRPISRQPEELFITYFYTQLQQSAWQRVQNFARNFVSYGIWLTTVAVNFLNFRFFSCLPYVLAKRNVQWFIPSLFWEITSHLCFYKYVHHFILQSIWYFYSKYWPKIFSRHYRVVFYK